MADLQAYDAQGNPIAGVRTPIAYNEKGLPIGSISEAADERRRKLDALTAPPQTSATRRFFQGMGVPTTKEEFLTLLKEGALNAATMGTYGTFFKPGMAISEDPSYTGVNRALNPMAGPMESFGEGNVAGGLGGTSANLLAGVAGTALAKVAPKASTTRPSTAQPPASVERLLPITMEPNAAPLPTRALSAFNKLINPMQHAADAYRTLVGKQPEPNTRMVPYEVLPDTPPPSISGESLLLDNPFANPTHGPLPLAENVGSPPLRTGADWFQPLTEAATGDAPAQNSAGRFLNPFPNDTAPMTFEPGSAGSTVTQGMTPPLGPADLQGIKGQTNQMLQSADVLGENAVAGFSPQQLQQLLQLLSQIPDK